MRHDGGHGGVDPPWRVLALLGQPGTAGILAAHRVADVAGQPRVAAMGELAVDDVDETTRKAVALRLRLHVYPYLGDYQLAALRPSVVQAWARGLQQQLGRATSASSSPT
jgi:Phage integrase, N-terminal SAM-like domain